MMPPPHLRKASLLSLNLAMHVSCRLRSCASSSGLTAVRAKQVAFFWCTSAPRRDLFLTMQYGIFSLRQSAGIHTTSSIGSTSEAITTSLASLSSIRLVTCFRPYLIAGPGGGEEASCPASFARASASRRSVFCALVSGWYLVSRRMSSTAWFLSMVFWNCASAGGTFRRVMITFRWRCRRMYLGHLTKRDKSRPLGRMSPPTR
mmetsp:Transcript_4223/g.16485  ORF Transcript_4223/g.16485 Transcript_4223/m.16485 type:complete len:204 (-) Transcript_4223:117-728(-)